MSYGSPVLRQHVVEFIRGTGIVTDGVTDAASVNGPWTWVAPNGVAQIQANMCSGGCGGGCGARVSDNATQQGGGGGGTGGLYIMGAILQVRPNNSLTVTAGAGGTAGTQAGTRFGGGGGTSSIAGVLLTPADAPFSLYQNSLGGQESGSSAGAPGRGVVSNNGSGGAVGAAGGNGQISFSAGFSGGVVGCYPAGGGGGANASASVAGSNGGRCGAGGDPFGWTVNGSSFTSASGNTTTTVSRGGGGQGGHSPWGTGGNGGAGGANGSSGTGFGAGGGGGGGGHTGSAGAGSPGYISITYWSQD